jgi:hypothetical protein
VRDLTPWQWVREEFVAMNPKSPEQVLVTLNLRDRKFEDVYRLNLHSGAVELDTINPGDIAEWLADDNLIVRGAAVITADEGTEIRVRDSAQAKWRRLFKVGMEDELRALDFSKDGRALLLDSSRGRKTLPCGPL